jgi:hypothetical protein
MTPITISSNLKEKFPKLRLGCIACQVDVKPSDKKIISLSENIFAKVCDELDIGDVSLEACHQREQRSLPNIGQRPKQI